MTAVRRTAMAVASVLALACLTPALAGPASAITCPAVTTDHYVVPLSAIGLNWSGCNLDGEILNGAVLTYTVLQGTHLHGASLRGANLTKADLTHADLSGADLTGADLTGANLTSANLTGATASGAILTAARLTGATVTTAALTGADLRGLIGTPVTGVPASAPAGWGVQGGWLLGPGVDLTGQTVGLQDFHGVDLTGATLTRTQLTQVNLAGATLTRVDLNGARLLQLNLAGATGLATARASATTSWTASICPDSVVAERHDGRSCQLALDTTAPRISLTTPEFATSASTPLPVSIVETGSGIEMYREKVWTAPTATSAYGRPTLSVWYGQDPRPYTLATGDGYRTCVQLQVRDFAGLASAWSPPHCTEGVIDDTGGGVVLATGRWGFAFAPDWIEGSAHVTNHHGDSMATYVPYTVHRLGVVGLTCRTCGTLALYVGTAKVGTISLVSSTSARRVLVLPRWPRAKRGVVSLVVTSPDRRLVKLDAIVVVGL